MIAFRRERGQALIIIVFAILGLFGLTALAVDGGMMYRDRQGAQTAADTAALTAALKLVRGQPDWSNAALDAATSNGYHGDGANITVAVNSPPAAGCDGNTPTFDDPAQYVQVVIHTTVKTYFAPVVGINETHNCVDAIARAAPGGSGPLPGGKGLMVLKSSVCGCNPLSFTGSGDVHIDGSIADNGNAASTGSGDFTVLGDVQVLGDFGHNGSGDWSVSGGFVANAFDRSGSQNWTASSAAVHGNFRQSGSGTFHVTQGNLRYGGTCSNSGSATVVPSAVHAVPAPVLPPIFVDPLADILDPPPAPPSFPCNGNVSYSGSTDHVLAGSCYGDVSQSGSGNLTLSPGRYASISNSGSGTLTLKPGIYYITGSSGINSTGSGNVIGNGVLIYLKTGRFNMSGTGNLALVPMPTGDYAGLTIYMDRSNTSTFHMNGSGDSSFRGTLYAPHADVTLIGSGTAFVIHSQVIAWTATLTGSGGLNLTYDPSENYRFAQDALIQLIK